MKFATILPFLASVAFAAESSEASTEAVSPAAPAPGIINPKAQRKYFKGGTYTVKPRGSSSGGLSSMGMMGGMGGMGGGETQSFIGSLSGSSFCGDCTVLAGQIVLKYMDGTIANISNGVYVHHILTSGLKANPAFVRSCAGGGLDGGSGFVGNGDDNSNEPVLYASKDGTLETGYWVSPTDRFMGTYVLVNYNKEPKKVEVWYDLEYLPGHVGKPVRSSLISASCTGISTTGSTGANGAALTTSSPMTFTESGYIVLARAHLHDGGVAMHLKVNRKSGTPYTCSSKAVYGKHLSTGGAEAAETIVDVENCNPHPIKVSAGDTMTMISEYNLKLHPLRETGHGKDAVMGMFRIIFASDK